MKESLFKPLFALVRYLAQLETTTTAGRINILGMLLSLILAISLSLAPLFETLIRLVHPSEEVGAPLLQIFVAFLIFTIVCAAMLGYLERPRSGSTTNPQTPREHSGSSPDSASSKKKRKASK